jgi:RNA polymerase sigma-70 factor (ECF subfamily)
VLLLPASGVRRRFACGRIVLPSSGVDEDRFRQLFAEIVHGDETAERELYDLLRPRLRGIAFARGVRTEDLDDVVQEVLSAVLEQLRDNRFRGLSSPSTWIVRILRNKIADEGRQRGRSERLLAAAAEELEVTIRRSRTSPQTHLEVMEALARLTPSERFVLTSTELGGLSYAEVAARLGCPVGTVASTKHRAVSRFRRFFGSSGAPAPAGDTDGNL